MVFCYQNWSDPLWEKIVLVIEKKKLKFEAEGREFENILSDWESSGQFFKQNTFFNFLTVKIPIGTNNWDVETYRNTLENTILSHKQCFSQ